MSTFLEMQTNIEEYLLRTDINDMVQLAINRAIKKYSKSRFWFMENQSDFVLVQGQWRYFAGDVEGVPADIRQVDYMRITVNNVYYQVYERNIQYIIDANVNNNQGQPIDFAWFNQAFYFYPIPQNNYIITLFYHQDTAALVFPTDFNVWTTNPEAEELIECEALYWLYKKVILDAEKAAEYKEAARDALRVLNEINEGKTGILGKIEATYW